MDEHVPAAARQCTPAGSAASRGLRRAPPPGSSRGRLSRITWPCPNAAREFRGSSFRVRAETTRCHTLMLSFHSPLRLDVAFTSSTETGHAIRQDKGRGRYLLQGLGCEDRATDRIPSWLA